MMFRKLTLPVMAYHFGVKYPFN